MQGFQWFSSRSLTMYLLFLLPHAVNLPRGTWAWTPSSSGIRRHLRGRMHSSPVTQHQPHCVRKKLLPSHPFITCPVFSCSSTTFAPNHNAPIARWLSPACSLMSKQSKFHIFWTRYSLAKRTLHNTAAHNLLQSASFSHADCSDCDD